MLMMDGAAKPNTSWLQWLPCDTTRLQRLGMLAADGVAPLGGLGQLNISRTLAKC